MDTIYHRYTYDAAYRLVSANGSSVWNNGNVPLAYNMNMNYSFAGRITDKYLYNERLSNNYGLDTLKYNNLYSYGYNGNPYALATLNNSVTGTQDKFMWDAKGNMKHHLDAFKKNERFMCWTEDNRLQAFMDNKNTAYYNYDASGERTMKLTGNTMVTTQNGVIVHFPQLQEATLYTNGLITVTGKGYTKHYYEEGNRICSKIGGGFVNPTTNLDRYNNGNPPVANDYLLCPATNSFAKGLEETFDNCMGKAVVYDMQSSLYHTLKTALTQNNPEPAFYYLTDHLGSSSYITDDNGNITQTMSYIPFGEYQVDLLHNNPAYTTPYKFNGKEKDEETGFNYFGARYYYDYLSIWLSVDPLMHKYPHLSPYVYCANNPVNAIDPNGMEIDGYYNLQGKKIYDDGNGRDKKHLVITNKNKISNLEGETIIDVPTNETVSKMEGLYADDVEKGMAVTIDGNTSKIVTGNRTFITSAQWQPAIDEIGGYGNVAYTIHSHPLNHTPDGSKYGESTPSPEDKTHVVGQSGINVVLGYYRSLLGHGTNYGGTPKLQKRIGFYNKDGLIVTPPMQFRDFKDAIRRIHKSK
ncbi:MAG: RHS repeat-associated core domain-containing protein [Bacteroidales bacterium]|jgi:RHS repeat-associated protein|nr:RHS repeat-associated core domain-containing protein [Bacteroidales bacterium]